MTLLGIAQIVIFFAVVVAITKPIGVFMHRVFEGERTFLHPVFRPIGTPDLLSSAASARERSNPGYAIRRP